MPESNVEQNVNKIFSNLTTTFFSTRIKDNQNILYTKTQIVSRGMIEVIYICFDNRIDNDTSIKLKL